MLASKARELMRLAPRGVRGLQTSAPAAGGMGLPVKYARAPETPFPEEAELKWYSGCVNPEPLFDTDTCTFAPLPQAIMLNVLAFSSVPLAGYIGWSMIKDEPKKFVDRNTLLPEDVAKARKAVGAYNPDSEDL
eukprot:PRCOL_00003445-RA